MKRKLISLLVVTLIVISLFPTSIFAATTSGNFSSIGAPGLTWQHDSTTKTLTIGGSGTMPNFTSSYTMSNLIGWKTIVNVVIEEGVGPLGTFAFYDIDTIQSIKGASTVTSIGNFTFANIYDDASRTFTVTGFTGLVSIGNNAFYESRYLSAFTIPATCTTIGPEAFSGCTNLATIVNESKTSQTVGSSAFSNIKSTASISYYPTNTTFRTHMDAYNKSFTYTYLMEPTEATLEEWLDAGNTAESWFSAGNTIDTYIAQGGTAISWSSLSAHYSGYLLGQFGGTSSGWSSYGGTASTWASSGGTSASWVAAGGDASEYEAATGGTTEESAVKVYVDEGQVSFPDVQPKVIDENILVPVRFVMESLGATVYWDDINKMAVIRKEENGNKIEIVMYPNQDSMVVNGDEYNLSTPIQIAEPGRLMLPGGEIVKAYQTIWYKMAKASSTVYEGYYYSSAEAGTESKLSNVPTITDYTDYSNLTQLTPDNEVANLSDDTNVCEIVFSAEPTNFSVTVPLVVTVEQLADGSVIVPTNCVITNNAPLGPIVISSIDIMMQGSWKAVDFNEDFGRRKVSAREFGMQLNGNPLDVGTKKVTPAGTLSNSIMPGESRQLDFGVKLGARASSLSAENLANIVFVFGWDSVN